MPIVPATYEVEVRASLGLGVGDQPGQYEKT